MFISSVDLRNFRCFDNFKLDFSSSIILISGPNGSGKTSILEALHYACYFKSFKSSINSELINLKQSNIGFAINVHLSDQNSFDSDVLNITLEGSGKKTIKLNQKNLTSYKELSNSYKIITITEDDMDLVKGYPDNRRSFIDHLILLKDPLYGKTLKTYKKVLKNRNSLFVDKMVNKDTYTLWTEQLYALSKEISKKRIDMLGLLDHKIKDLIKNTETSSFDVYFEYVFSKGYSIDNKNLNEFIESYPNIMNHESFAGRSLFGAHLDDFIIKFNEKSSRNYSSRGQQKLVLFLLKIACLQIIESKAVFLVDDFMTDFDETKVDILVDLMIQNASQIILTSPASNPFLESKISKYNAQIIRFNR